MSDRRAAGYVPLDALAEEGNAPGASQQQQQQQQQPQQQQHPNHPPLSSTPPPPSTFNSAAFTSGRSAALSRQNAPGAAAATAKRSATGALAVGRMDTKRTLAPGQPAVATRKEGRFVSLPESLDSLFAPEPESAEAAAAAAASAVPLPAPPPPGEVLPPPPHLDGSSSPPPPGTTTAALPAIVGANLASDQQQQAETSADLRGRIAIYCLADGFDMKALATALEARGSAHLTHRYEEAFAGHFIDVRGSGLPVGDCFYFEYGVFCAWGLTREQESDIVHSVLTSCLDEPLAAENWEVDEFTFCYSSAARPSIANDTITLPLRHAADHVIKLSISHALAQSTKLMLYEELILELVSATKEIPQQLSATGKVALSRKAIAQLMGRTLNLRSSVQLSRFALTVPDFFWSAADALQALYNRVRQYLELDERVEVLSTRFDLLVSVLELARQAEDARHAHRLEWIVIWLIAVEIVIGIATIMSGGGGGHK